MEKTFKGHNYIWRACESDNDYTFINVKKEGKYLVCNDLNKIGEIVSPVINALDYDELVGSFSCITNPDSTCELQVRVKINNEFSKYFTYGEWGLGKPNYYYNQDDKKVKMNVDEILLKDNNLGNGFQFKVIIKNKAKLSLICIALRIVNYDYHFEIKENMPSIVYYNVPKLNQNIVPVIGHEICSATTSTMLLKFKGFDFTKNDQEFEHRYIASLVADPGHNSPTYGNWCYNTATIASFGCDSYVARTYSWDELKYHLAKIGPVGASIKGDTGVYKTNGHLIVVCGYKEVDGKTLVICNDPNINARFGKGNDGSDLFVYYEFPLETFMKFYRGVMYVVL